jgi:hypothetical protein
MFAIVRFGYRQARVFNLNCQVAPLLDAIASQSTAEIKELLTAKSTQFAKEIEDLQRRTAAFTNKLEYLERPPPETERSAPVEEVKQPPPVEEVKAKPDPKKEAAAKGKKDTKKQEVKELTPEELKQQKLNAEKEELRRQIAEAQQRMEVLQRKVEQIQQNLAKFAVNPPDIDLQDVTGARKFLKTRKEESAVTLLNAKATYQLMKVVQDQAEPYNFDGFCVRTIEEDATFVEETPDPRAKKGKKK